MPPSRELLSPFHQFLVLVRGSLTYDNQKPVHISKLKLWVPNPTDGVTKEVQTYLREQKIKHKVHFITFDPIKTPKAPWNDNWLVLGIPLERGSSTVKSIEDDILAHMPPNSILSVCGEWDRDCYFFPLERQNLTHQFYKRRGRYDDLLLLRDYSVWDESQFHGGFSGEDEIFADAVRRQLCAPLSPGEECPKCPICRLGLTNSHPEDEDPEDKNELLEKLRRGVVMCAPCGHSFHLACIEPFWESQKVSDDYRNYRMCAYCNTGADSVHTVTISGPVDCQKILRTNLLSSPFAPPGPGPAPSSLERLLPHKVRMQKEATAKQGSMRYDPLRRSSRSPSLASKSPRVLSPRVQASEGPWQAPVAVSVQPSGSMDPNF